MLGAHRTYNQCFARAHKHLASLSAVCQVIAQSGMSILMRGTKGLSTYNVTVVRFGTSLKTMQTWLRKYI